MKKLIFIISVLISQLAFSGSNWISKTPVTVYNTTCSFKFTFADSSTAYIQKSNVSYIVPVGTYYVQMGFNADGSTSRIINIPYTVTDSTYSSSGELADTLNDWMLIQCGVAGESEVGDSQSLYINIHPATFDLGITRGNALTFHYEVDSLYGVSDSMIYNTAGYTRRYSIPVSSFLTLSNGLTKTAGVGKLGGVLTGNTTIGGTAGGGTLQNLTIGAKQLTLSGNTSVGYGILMSGIGTLSAQGVSIAGTSPNDGTVLTGTSSSTGTGAYIIGNSTSGTDVKIETQSSHTILIDAPNGKIYPATDSSTDLGDATHRWKEIYVSSGSLHLGNTTVSESGYNLKMNYSDTSTLSARINQRMKYTDTASLSSRINQAVQGTIGSTTFSGVSLQTTYTITHSLSYTPSAVFIQPRTLTGAILSYVTNITSTTFDIVFLSAPTIGSNNISFSWVAYR